MQTTTTEKVIDCLANGFCIHGLPNTIKSDNGPQFKSNEFREYCEQHSILNQKVSANGEVERQNSSLLKRPTDSSGSKHSLGSRIKEKSHCLQKHSHSTTGRSPADLLFNQKVKGKIPDLNVDHAYDLEVHDGDTEQKAKSKVLFRLHIAHGQSLQHRTG